MTDLIAKYRYDTDIIPCTIYQDDGETTDDLSLFTNILVLLCSEKFILDNDSEQAFSSDLIIEKYAMNEKEGFNTDDFKIVGDGSFNICVQNSVIAAMKRGELYKCVFLLYKTNSDYESGYEIETLEELYIERK